MHKITIKLRTPNEVWTKYFLAWLQQVLKTQFDTFDQYGIVIIEDDNVEIFISQQ